MSKYIYSCWGQETLNKSGFLNAEKYLNIEIRDIMSLVNIILGVYFIVRCNVLLAIYMQLLYDLNSHPLENPTVFWGLLCNKKKYTHIHLTW